MEEGWIGVDGFVGVGLEGTAEIVGMSVVAFGFLVVESGSTGFFAEDGVTEEGFCVVAFLCVEIEVVLEVGEEVL